MLVFCSSIDTLWFQQPLRSPHVELTVVYHHHLLLFLGSCNGHSGSVKDCAFSPNGRLLLTVSADKTAKLWEGHSLRNLATFQRGDSVLVVGVSVVCV